MAQVTNAEIARRLKEIRTLMEFAGEPFFKFMAYERAAETVENTAPLTDVLADWGTALSAGEEVEFFRLTDIDERPGYLLVTNERLMFFERTGRKDHEKLFEYPLAAVTPSYSRGTLRGPRLRLLGRGWEHVVRSSSRADLRRLAGCLADAAAPGRRGAGQGAAEH